MKTQNHELRNLITKTMSKTPITKIALIFIVLFSTVACKKETPIAVVDRIAPDVRLQITGANTSMQFTSPNDYSNGQFNILANNVYTFYCVASDTASGLETFELRLSNHPDIEFFDIQCSNPFSEVPGASPSTKKIVVQLNRADPYSAVIITGKFRANAGEEPSITPLVFDYNRNRSSFTVNCYNSANGPYGWIRF